MMPRPTRYTLFPYTTLFRSLIVRAQLARTRPSAAATRAGADQRKPNESSEGANAGQDQDFSEAHDQLLARRGRAAESGDRKSTRLNSSHANISYAVFCLKKK